MLKTLLLTALILTYTPITHAACLGYQNNMDALEAVMQQHRNEKPSKPQYQSTPPVASINQSLNALEKAVKDHNAAKQKTNSTKTP